MRGMRRLNCFAVVHLGHPADTSASQPGVLIAVAPAVHGTLNETPLAA